MKGWQHMVVMLALLAVVVGGVTVAILSTRDPEQLHAWCRP